MHQSPNETGAAVKAETMKQYEKFAPWYDLVLGILEFLGVKNLRRRLLHGASGRVLEIAVGTGKNLQYYSGGCKITAVDLSPAMLEIARKRGIALSLHAAFLVMDGETLAFRDQSFDTVVDSLTLCTFPDPVVALREMARVCRTDGRILLLEHGRSEQGWLGHWQDRKADHHARKLGCRWNREPLDLVSQAGLTLISSRRTVLGIFHEIEAKPPKTGGSLP